MVLAKISQATSGLNKVVTGPEFPWPCKYQIQRSQPTERVVETAATYFVAGPRGDLFLAQRVGMGLPDGMDNGVGPYPGEIVVLLIVRAPPVDRNMERLFLSASIVAEVASQLRRH
jgi:hypothetical protein